MEKIRIQKLLADAGYCSRRQAEKLISDGKVKVNGHPVKLGDKATLADLITVGGERVYLPRKKQYRYLMLYKPRGYVTTTSDELNRRCVMDLLEDVEERVYPVGRLDKDSEGLLLLTNDGSFANGIMHPSRHISKTYRVTVRPDVTEEQLIALSGSMELDGKMTQPATVVVKTKEPGRVVLLMTIHEGKNRQIRRMCESVGLEVARLRRISIGPLKLGMLKPGTYRDLTAEELRAFEMPWGPAKPLLRQRTRADGDNRAYPFIKYQKNVLGGGTGNANLYFTGAAGVSHSVRGEYFCHGQRPCGSSGHSPAASAGAESDAEKN